MQQLQIIKMYSICNSCRLFVLKRYNNVKCTKYETVTINARCIMYIKEIQKRKRRQRSGIPHLVQDTTWESDELTNKSQEVGHSPAGDHKAAMNRRESMTDTRHTLEDLNVLKGSPDLLNNIKISQGQLRLII